jgi:hypothetical protein
MSEENSVDLTSDAWVDAQVDEYFNLSKEQWIPLHGSDFLRKAFLTYDCETGYLSERLALDYPGFELARFRLEKIDTPSELALEASLAVRGSYCCCWCGHDYIAIDNYLGSYQIAREVFDCEDEPTAFSVGAESKSDGDYQAEKCEWISLCGAEDLKRSFWSGYACDVAYLNERLTIEHPGFDIRWGYTYKRADAPPKYAIDACLLFDGSYCSQHAGNYYITIDNYLGVKQITKNIESPKVDSDRNFFHTERPILPALGISVVVLASIKLMFLLAPSANTIVNLAPNHPLEACYYIGHEIVSDWIKKPFRTSLLR